MYCPNCGIELPSNDSRFCNSCGTIINKKHLDERAKGDANGATYPNSYPQAQQYQQLQQYQQPQSPQQYQQPHQKTVKKRRRVLPLIIIAAIIAVGITAGVLVIIKVDVKSVAITEACDLMYIGESFNAVAEIEPSNAWFKKTSWFSSDDAIAAIDAEGRITALSAGTVTITVVAGKTMEDSFTLNIINEPKEITLKGIPNTMYASMVHQMEFSVVTEGSGYRTLEWTSSDNSIATVDANGVVTGVSAGAFTVRAELDNGVFAEISAEIAVSPTSIAIKAGEVMIKGDIAEISAAVSPSEAKYDAMSWVSSDESVLSIGDNGKVTAVGAGTATITAKVIDGVEESVTVTVFDSKVDCLIDFVKKNGTESEGTLEYSLYRDYVNEYEVFLLYTPGEDEVKIAALATSDVGELIICTMVYLPNDNMQTCWILAFAIYNNEMYASSESSINIGTYNEDYSLTLINYDGPEYIKPDLKELFSTLVATSIYVLETEWDSLGMPFSFIQLGFGSF